MRLPCLCFAIGLSGSFNSKRCCTSPADAAQFEGDDSCPASPPDGASADLMDCSSANDRATDSRFAGTCSRTAYADAD